MKINKMIVLGLVATSLMASCKKETPASEDNNLGNLNLNGISFSASTEEDDSDTKTYLSGTDIRWMANDLIRIKNNSNQQVPFQVVEGIDTHTGTFYTGYTFSRTPAYDAAYPYDMVTISGTTATFTIPNSQTMNMSKVGSFGNGAMPMVAHSTNNTLNFKNVFGGIVFPLIKNDDITTVKRIVLVSNISTEKLWGKFTASCNSNTPNPTYVSDGNNTIELVCPSAVTLSNTATDFVIMIPPGTLEKGFMVSVYDGNDNLVYRKKVEWNDWSAEHGNGKDLIQRSKLRKVGTNIKPGIGFSVSNSQRVRLSLGNLQWSAKNGDERNANTTHNVAGGGTAAGTFRFSEHPWDRVGGGPGYGNVNHKNASGASVQSNNDSRAENYAGWIDLFAWGTSCWSGDGCVSSYMPYQISLSPYNYLPGGSSTANISGTNADWGVYNAIWNPARNAYDAPGTWRTLTSDEWHYLLRSRVTDGKASVCFAKVRLSDLPNPSGGEGYGLVIPPDEWLTSTFNFTCTSTTSGFQDITLAQWQMLEKEGCVFLPVAGDMHINHPYNTTIVFSHQSRGFYWSSTANDVSYACDFSFANGQMTTNVSGGAYNYGERWCPRSVRLVRNINY